MTVKSHGFRNHTDNDWCKGNPALHHRFFWLTQTGWILSLCQRLLKSPECEMSFCWLQMFFNIIGLPYSETVYYFPQKTCSSIKVISVIMSLWLAFLWELFISHSNCRLGQKSLKKWGFLTALPYNILLSLFGRTGRITRRITLLHQLVFFPENRLKKKHNQKPNTF